MEGCFEVERGIRSFCFLDWCFLEILVFVALVLEYDYWYVFLKCLSDWIELIFLFLKLCFSWKINQQKRSFAMQVEDFCLSIPLYKEHHFWRNKQKTSYRILSSKILIL